MVWVVVVVVAEKRIVGWEMHQKVRWVGKITERKALVEQKKPMESAVVKGMLLDLTDSKLLSASLPRSCQ
jgi:hypothetical protein